MVRARQARGRVLPRLHLPRYETAVPIHLTRRFGLDGTPDFRDAEELITLWERWARGEEQANAVDADLARAYIEAHAACEEATANLISARNALTAAGPRRIHGYCNVTMTESKGRIQWEKAARAAGITDDLAEAFRGDPVAQTRVSVDKRRRA